MNATTRKILWFLPALWTGVGLMIYGGVTDNGNLIGVGVALFVVTFIGAIAVKVSKAGAEQKARAELWRTGIPGKARILNIHTDGGGLNDNPLIQFDLEVTVEGKDPYQLQTEFMVSKIRLPAVQPGEEIEIRVDPADPDKIAPDETIIYPGYSD